MTQKDTPNFKEQGRRLSPVLSKIILQAEEGNQQILTTKDFVEYYKITDTYARKMMADLVKAGWLVRVGPGKYQLQPAKTGLDPYPTADKFVAAGQLSSDGFIAYGSAAEYYGLTSQVFNSVAVATTKRSRIREAPPVRIEYLHIDANNFVGFQNIATAPGARIASIERTLIDVLERPDYCGGISDIPEVYRRARSRAKTEKILEYLPTYRSKSMAQRTGYMLEVFGYQLTSQQEQTLQDFSQGNFAYLFAARHAGPNSHNSYSSKWRLVINAPGFLPAEKAE